LSKNKIAIAIALLLTLTIAFSFVALPKVNAATINHYSWVYVADGAGHRGTGVNQPILLVAWTADIPPDTGEILGVVQSPSGRAGWDGMQIQVWDPDNETTILPMPFSDPVGANYILYTPTKVGTYRIQSIFPYTDKEVKVTISSGGSNYVAGDHYIYTAAVSPIDTFEVLQEAPPTWPESPLPNDYWTRPISGASRTWSVLAGSWLGGAANVWPTGGSGGTVGSYAYGSAPESAHILWSKPFWIGGIMDERYGDIGYQTAHYQGVEFSPTIVLDGKIHWTPRYTSHGNQGWEVIDLYSGETLYKDYNATAPNMGQIYNYESPNQHGGFAYLWQTGGGGGFFFGGGTPVQVPEVIALAQTYQATVGTLPVRTGSYITVNRTQTPVSLGTVWEMIDAHSLKPICYIANVSTSGTQVYGKDGSILYYNTVNKGTTANPNYYCTVWNSSCGTMVVAQHGTGSWQWRPAGGDFGAENPYFGSPSLFTPFTMNYNIVHDGNQMWWQNFSIPSLLGPRNSVLNETATVRAIREGEIMIVGTQGVNDYRGVAPGFMMGISLEPGKEGTQLWKTTFTPPFTDATKNVTAAAMFTGGFSLTGVYPEDGVFTFGEVKQLKVWVFDLHTGKELWESEQQPQYNYYGQSQAVIDHKLIVYGGYSGQFNAYNITTGEKVWTFYANNIGDESPYGNYPMQISAVADGKIYTTSWEHSYTQPIIRGPNLRCINATDGKEIFSILSWGCNTVAISDGILVAGSSVDNNIYAYGKGPSATTVSAPQTVPSLGSSVMITGTVTDQSPSGRRNTNDLLDFTLKGTPAISDEDMSAWMEYKFMQQAKPADAKGVEVSLDTIDPNGNYVHIATVTSDINGNYGYSYTPDVPGTYQIIATFAGSKSYGPSSATTYLDVVEAPTATAPPEYPQPIDPTMTIVYAAIAIIIAVAIVGILLLRKK
jgi:outer membrane protein assembly factor BamB